MTKKTQKKPKIRRWIGLQPQRFYKYRKWINRSHPGICGTYVTGVMLHDFLNKEYNLLLDQEEVIVGMQSVVDDLFPYRGTFMWDLKYGLNYMLKNFPEWRARMHLVPDTKVVDLLNGEHPRPIAVGTTKFLGNSYKNHWVLAYAYGYDVEENELYFKVYDNHGKHNAIVKASQTVSCVWIEHISENK